MDQKYLKTICVTEITVISFPNVNGYCEGHDVTGYLAVAQKYTFVCF